MIVSPLLWIGMLLLSTCDAFMQSRFRLDSIIPLCTVSTNVDEAAAVETTPGLLGCTLKELSDQLEGSGRATAVWDCIRQGIDPNLYYSKFEDTSDSQLLNSWLESSIGIILEDEESTVLSTVAAEYEVPSLGKRVVDKLQSVMKEYKPPSQDDMNMLTIENCIASISGLKVSSDGTTKLLLRMAKDGLEVESVIIPWKEKGFSTLCVSSQVGCKQGCTFCATGRMGKLRSLSVDEIIVQVYYASKVCRIVQPHFVNNPLPKIDNIVFMGMGEPADAADSVIRAVNTMTDRRMFKLAQSKITISTVAPDTKAFETLGQAPALLAFSVHAVRDSIRQRLVPSTKNSMEELRLSLVQTLLTRTKSLRRTMLEVVLIDGINDSDEDARHLAEYARSIMNEVESAKVVINLIPFNEIGHPTYKAPLADRVLDFQRIIVHGDDPVKCYIRTTRGDEESSACGQLATMKKRKLLVAKRGEYDLLM